MAVSSGFLVLFLIAIPTAYAAQHVVGGNSGWTNFGVNYGTWAAGETFTVGDTLLFNYDSSTHSLAEVPQAGYSGCSSSNAIQTYNDGATTVTLSKAGPMYFICPTAGHCGGGMKLQINVVAASTTPGTTPATPSPPSGTTTPPAAGTPPTTPATNTPPTPSSNDAATLLSNLILGSLLVLGTSVALLG